MRLFTRDSLERMGVTTRSVQSERRPRVKLHRNAKTTPSMRALLVPRIGQDQWPPAAAAAAAGISVRTTYKWLRRHRLGGRPALEDASSRPHRQPRRTSPTVVAAIVAARHERRTAWAIATRLQVPRSTVAAVLARLGLNRLARLEPPVPVRRYERTRPGALVHLDRRVVCSAWDQHRPRVNRQRQRVPQSPLSDDGGALSRPPLAHAPVSSTNQRESRTIHPNAHSRLGVRRVVSQLLAPAACAASLAPALQRRAASRRPRLSATVRPLSEGRPVINLVRTHT